jgi:predicted nucleic acid-binding Zn ribbon protein
VVFRQDTQRFCSVSPETSHQLYVTILMYLILLVLHSYWRWVVLLSLVYAIYRGIRGFSGAIPFTKTDNLLRHTTATTAHVQLLLGYLLYVTSSMVSYFRSHYAEASRNATMQFFGLTHVLLMTIAIVLITIGSSVAKRQQTDRAKFRTMTIWFVLALLVIFVAIPWPFSPLANRPYFRLF